MSSLIHFFLLLLLLFVRSVWPQSICSNPSLPYKVETNDDCANFDRICLKQDDRQCSNFLNICAQCPPSNYSTIMMRDMVKMIVEVNSKVSKVSDKTDSVVTICIVIIIIQLILFLALLLENRFKLITKCCGYICGDKSSQKQFNFSESRKYSDYRMMKNIKSVENVLDSKIHSKLDEITDLLKNPENPKSAMIFQMEGESQTIELHIKNKDCIVDVKKKICDKLENGINFKSLKLKFNGKILDDNQYFLPAVGWKGKIVNCVVDNEVAASHFLVVKQRENTNLPHLLQFKKDETVAGMKRHFTKYLPMETFKVFKESNEMEDSKMIGDYVSRDSDVIRVIKCESGRVVLYSMFNESERLEIEYSNVDKVSSIVEKVSKKFGTDSKDIILFNNLQNCIEDKCIFEYDVNVNSKILFYYPMKVDEIEQTGDTSIDSGFTSELYRGFNNAKQTKILIKYYKDTIKRFLDKEYFIEELISCEELMSHRMFVRVLGIQKSEGLLNVVMENVSEVTLNMVLKREKTFSESDIHGYLKQIMEALKYLHDKDIPYGSLNPYNIFVGEDKKIKLSSFNVSKYFRRNDLNKELQIQFKNTNLSVSYVAPEMKMKKLTEKPMDIWCLGVLLIDFVNDGMPVVTINEVTSKVSYKLKNAVSVQLKEFIKACLKYDPNQRPTVDQLMNHKFYKK